MVLFIYNVVKIDKSTSSRPETLLESRGIFNSWGNESCNFGSHFPTSFIRIFLDETTGFGLVVLFRMVCPMIKFVGNAQVKNEIQKHCALMQDNSKNPCLNRK